MARATTIGERNAVSSGIGQSQIGRRIYREPAAKKSPVHLDWEAVLYFGPDHVGASIGQSKIAVAAVPPPRRGETRTHQRSAEAS